MVLNFVLNLATNGRLKIFKPNSIAVAA